ncbi:hypothetical protein C4D60_Mb00t19150 [Musa balbisiana]|uniref:Uncharacterized protein n=1 Tax=Musa balbisiana TaxID=52838 RepID=A0A4S8I3R3_MUSBA|nr:hypothetical protein C4D60_Mb00t19150 [Musa balbisiana]
MELNILFHRVLRCFNLTRPEAVRNMKRYGKHQLSTLHQDVAFNSRPRLHPAPPSPPFEPSCCRTSSPMPSKAENRSSSSEHPQSPASLRTTSDNAGQFFGYDLKPVPVPVAERSPSESTKKRSPEKRPEPER